MHETLKEIQEKLEELDSAINESISHDATFGQQSGNWAFPVITKHELRDRVKEIRQGIETFGKDRVDHHSKRLSLYPNRIQFLIDSTVPNIEGNAQQAVPALLVTLDGLERALKPNLDGDPNKQAIKRVNNLNNRLRSREAQLKNIGPKLDDLDKKIERIENAHASADQLPTDLETLKEARASIKQIQTDVEADRKLVDDAWSKAKSISELLEKKKAEADSVLARCETAYSAATSVGLAAAFSQRSKSLGISVWVWTALLVASLGIAGLLGFWRIEELATTLADQKSSDAKTALQFLLSVLSIGAPVWFAWLATRQIGQRFRIAEDYAFKASVSQAYEGYRREAARIDADMEQQLLGSALSRLDEQPLRLVESESHSSPMNELLSSKAVQRALNTIPNFANNVKELATSKLSPRDTKKTRKVDEVIDPDEVPETVDE